MAAGAASRLGTFLVNFEGYRPPAGSPVSKTFQRPSSSGDACVLASIAHAVPLITWISSQPDIAGVQPGAPEIQHFPTRFSKHCMIAVGDRRPLRSCTPVRRLHRAGQTSTRGCRGMRCSGGVAECGGGSLKRYLAAASLPSGQVGTWSASLTSSYLPSGWKQTSAQAPELSEPTLWPRP